MGMIDDAMVVFRTMLSQHAGCDLGYARSVHGDHQWFKGVKIPLQEADLIDINRVSTNQRYMDWLLLEPLDEDTFGTSTSYPMRGDQLYWHQSPTAIHRYEVASVGDAPAWEYNDPTHGTIRIHSLYLGVDANPPAWTLTPPA